MDREGPPYSRLFLVCGKHATEEMLSEKFMQYGRVQNVKLIREKGVGYIKYDRASSAAAAQEALHETVLNDGRTKLKVMIAEAPNARRTRYPRNGSDIDLASDPDNVPARSRLFIVVPKTADPKLIEEALSRWPDLQYCKMDLVASKGVAFCKFSRSSSALKTLESILETSMLAGYKVKCMLAEPKNGRSRSECGSGTLEKISWQVDRGPTASPSTSGSRGGVMCGSGGVSTEQSAPVRSGYVTNHGLSPGHCRPLSATYSDGAINSGSRPPSGFRPAGFQGPIGEVPQDNQTIMAQLGLAALASFAQGAVSGSHHAQSFDTRGFVGQGQDGPPLQHQTGLHPPQQMFTRQSPSGGSPAATSTQGVTSAPTESLALHMQQQLQHQQLQQQQQQQQLLLGAVSGANSDGSMSSLAAQVGLGSAAGLGLGLGLGIGAGTAFQNNRGLQNLSLGSLVASIHQPLTHQRELGASLTADISSAGSMSVCTTSGLRSSEAFSRQRLFVVCHKGATEDMLASLFKMWPDLEYLDLKRDRTSGASKGFCYVNYGSKEAAGAAMDTLNGIEWPPASGTRLKVMYAEPRGSRRPPLSGAVGSRHVPTDSLESAAHAVPSPQGEDETSSRLRPLPSPVDTGGELGRGLHHNDFGSSGGVNGVSTPHDGHIAVHVASAAMADHDASHTQPGLPTIGTSLLDSSAPSTAMHHPQQQQQQLQHFSRQGSDTDISRWAQPYLPIGQAAALDRLQQQQQQQGDLEAMQSASRQAHLAQMQQLQHAVLQGPTMEQQQQQQSPLEPHSLQLPIHMQQQQSETVDLTETAVKTGRKQPAAAAPASCDMNWESADTIGAEEQRVYTTLPRPLPDYSLQHVFAQFGVVDFVRLQSDPRHGVVQFASAESAAAALKGLAGSSITGLALTLSATDPLQPRNSKRPRVAS